MRQPYKNAKINHLHRHSGQTQKRIGLCSVFFTFCFQKFPQKKNRRKDAAITLLLLALATALSFLYFSVSRNSANVALLYILALVLIARVTDGYFWGIFASMIGVVCVNFLFTYPYWALNFTLAGYPVTFIGMLAISFITSAAATHMKQQMKMLAERERLLVEAEKEKMRANLLRAISHDLRTPDRHHRFRRILSGKRGYSRRKPEKGTGASNL